MMSISSPDLLLRSRRVVTPGGVRDAVVAVRDGRIDYVVDADQFSEKSSIEVPVEVVSRNARPDRGTFEPGIGVRFCETRPEVQEKLDELYEVALQQAGDRVAGVRHDSEPQASE